MHNHLVENCLAAFCLVALFLSVRYGYSTPAQRKAARRAWLEYQIKIKKEHRKFFKAKASGRDSGTAL